MAKAVTPCPARACDGVLFGMGRQQGRQHRALLEQGDFGRRGSAHLQDDVGIGQRGRAASGAMVAPAAA